MKKILTFMLSLTIATQLCATSQIPDKIVYEGETYELVNMPLEPFFERHPDKRPKSGVSTNSVGPRSVTIWTNLSREYIATFEVKDKQLFVKDIAVLNDMRIENDKRVIDARSVMSDVFTNGVPQKAEWVGGVLVMAKGEDVVSKYSQGYKSSMFDGWPSSSENFVVLEIAQGNITQALHFTTEEYDAFYNAQYDAFKKSDDHQPARDALKSDHDYSEKSIDWILERDFFDFMPKIFPAE